MMRIEEFSLTEELPRMGALLAAHWDEIARNKQLVVLKPDAERYRLLEQAGALLTIGAFDENDKMVAYSVNFIGHHLHYADLVYAENDVLFLAPAHRKGRLGLRLIKETEQRAKARGARMMVWHAKQDTSLERLLPRLGYGVQDVLFSKEV